MHQVLREQISTIVNFTKFRPNKNKLWARIKVYEERLSVKDDELHINKNMQFKRKLQFFLSKKYKLLNSKNGFTAFSSSKKCYTYHAHFGYSIKTSRKRYVGRPNFTPENTKIFDQYNSNQLSNGRGGITFLPLLRKFRSWIR